MKAQIRDYTFDRKKDRQIPFLLTSDLHIEAPDNELAEMHRDFQHAIDNGARIYINGDVFNNIFFPDMRRFTPSQDIFGGDTPVNRVIKYGIEQLTPYINHIDFIGYGNHETSCIRKGGYDVIEFLVLALNRLRDPSLPPIMRGAYSGFVRMVFHTGKSKRAAYDMYYWHGGGKGGEVTGARISLQRKQTSFIADCIWMGHIHQTEATKKTIIGMNQLGNLYTKKQWHISTGGYYGDLKVDTEEDFVYHYAEERIRTPSAGGSAMLLIVPQWSPNDCLSLDARVLQ